MRNFSYKDIKILYEDNHLLVVVKPPNLIMQADYLEKTTILTLMREYLQEVHNKSDKVYLVAVHRLDRPVGGVCILAKSSKGASRLSLQLRHKSIKRLYQAVVHNTPKRMDSWQDYLYKDQERNFSSVVSKDHPEARLAKLNYQLLKAKDNLSLVEVQLETGRSHQIRVQCASRNYPIWGDQRYNKAAEVGQQIALWAVEVSFFHPTTREELTFTSTVPQAYPWSLFKE